MQRYLRVLAPLAAVLVLTAAFAQPAPPPPSASAGASAPPATAPAPPASAAAAPPPASAAPSAASAAPPADAPEEPAFPVEEYKLSNGLRVILAPDDSLPNVAVHIRYDVGSGDEPEGLSGIAHLVEHLMFERAVHVPNGSLMRTLSQAGATAMNGETSFDATIYYETVPPEQLELALWLESDRMGYFLPALDEAALSQERTVVTTEMRTRYYDQSAGKMPLFLYEASFPAWHPYHTGPIGIFEELQKMSLADVRAFAATWYGPDNASLILVGRFQREQAKALVTRYFATLPSRPPPKRPVLPEVVRKGPTRLAVRANTGRELAYLSWVTPPHGAAGDYALDWIAEILATESSGRLHERLVLKGLAEHVGAGQQSMKLASLFRITLRAADEKGAEDLVKIVDEELTRLATSGPTPEEMKRIGWRFRVNDTFALESATARASRLSAAAGLGPIPGSLDWLHRKRGEITADEIRAAAKTHLAPAGRAGLVLLKPKWTAPRWGVVIDREEP